MQSMMATVPLDALKAGRCLPVMEQFYTLQGEGFHSGRAAYFIRLGGCDVGCHWCDVKESWEADKHPLMPVDEIAAQAAKHANTAIITGGEPLMWPMDGLTQKLRERQVKTHLETSGAHPVSGVWNWICLSPKKFKAPQEGIYPLANELKVVVYNASDFQFAEMHAEKVSTGCLLYLQPEWSRRDKVIPLIVEYVMKNPKWKVCIQLHKYLSIP